MPADVIPEPINENSTHQPLEPEKRMVASSSTNEILLSNAQTQLQILAAINIQNKLLGQIYGSLSNSMTSQNPRHNNILAQITDVDMSIGSMITLSFKWLVAAIPVGIVLGLIYVVLAVILTASLY